MMVPAATTTPRSRGTGAMLAAFAGALVVFLADPFATLSSSAAFVSAPQPAGRLLARSSQHSAADEPSTAMSASWKWVEPTIPEDLVEAAKEEGFRLRPKYSHMKIGYVVSDKNSKTRVALVEYFLFNAKYGAYYKRSKKKHFHDEYEVSKLGDVVLITPYRKKSTMKSYRLVEVLKKSSVPTRV
eukprot:gb/GFBE01039711.1/.p1 GENE.gb/GFBE01039711.1/~~gb/GFBE01039711.1/.p1  ORF type:complete len:185 (+),score=49.36 gb/GFBE01039711.1/:1-555(+)